MTLASQIRKALHDMPEKIYATSKRTGIDTTVLYRFSKGRWIGEKNLNKLADYLGLRVVKRR